jgi:hypothetical protein
MRVEVSIVKSMSGNAKLYVRGTRLSSLWISKNDWIEHSSWPLLVSTCLLLFIQSGSIGDRRRHKSTDSGISGL